MEEHAYELIRQQFVRARLDEAFEFFRDPRNLQEITPPWLGFAFRTPPPPDTRKNTRFEYRIRLAGVPMSWRTLITEWDPPHRFVDVQESGPYALWEHTHEFVPMRDGVLMTDRVRYALPLGALGRAAHAAVVRGVLARIFDYRFDVIRGRFG